MDYRGKTNDSESSDNEDDGHPVNSQDTRDDDEEVDEGPSTKRAAYLWTDTLVEESLMKKGSRISLEKKKTDGRILRGVESYHIPANFIRVDKEGFESFSKSMERKVKVDTADDPFGDAPIDLNCETAFCERLSSDVTGSRDRDAVASSKKRGAHYHLVTDRGRGPQGRPRGGVRGGFVGRGRGNGLKRSWQGRAIALFEEMRKVESTGGMMTENGQRRRTPGGVFISVQVGLGCP
ncbi:hypothetical protein TELCIR_17343 [Teladorsagia circumcincta]|uniref:Phosphorylated adapter RNA export protein n=1 Tax=Teladorsagia circumcincta TaxID=45464 RepID=A0A2G9TUK9_TELCI|nr:hypothetical protein TELCIR_17343 [Teladorsagia circumcincta]